MMSFKSSTIVNMIIITGCRSGSGLHLHVPLYVWSESVHSDNNNPFSWFFLPGLRDEIQGVIKLKAIRESGTICEAEQEGTCLFLAEDQMVSGHLS
jgi:hypothetical protein